MRKLSRILLLIGFVAGTSVFGQQAGTETQSDLTARTLYYNSGDTTPTPVRAVKRPARAATATATSTMQAASTPAPLPDTPVPHSAAPAQTATTPVPNLGVRYNVLLVDPGSGNGQPVDPAATFHPNDCLALSIQSNYNGYLYVMDKGSSGKWDVLIPSTEMTDESNFVPARTNVRAPAQYCFSVDSPAGVEHMYIVLARNPQDISELNSAVKAQRTGGSAAPSSPASDDPASRPIETQMAKLEQVMHSRDLKITKVSHPSTAGEPANAVYVVDTSHGATDRLITEIDIKHN